MCCSWSWLGSDQELAARLVYEIRYIQLRNAALRGADEDLDEIIFSFFFFFF